METTKSQTVKDYTKVHYLEPARRRGDPTVNVRAGDVQRGVGLSNRVALVCQALKAKKFLAENHLVLEKWVGPKSGMSTTVVFTYRFADDAPEPDGPTGQDPLMRLWEIGKKVFQSLGGGEAFIRGERNHFHGSDRDRQA